MEQTDGALGYGVVLVVECCQDPRQMTQRRNLVGQLALSAKQTNCCCGNCLQGLTLEESRKGKKGKYWYEKKESKEYENKLKQDTHIGVIFLQQLSQGLQEGNQELSRLA